MNKNKRVLMVDSVEDAVTQRRHQIFQSSPRLQDYDLDYCYSTDLSPAQRERLDQGFKPDLTVAQEELERRIGEKIRTFKPHYAVLHTGFVFRDYPEVFYRVFAALKARHHGVSFGYQEKPGLVVPDDCFHKSSEIIAIQRLLFHEILGLPTS